MKLLLLSNSGESLYEWCKIATKATGKKWVYKLIPHTAVTKVDTFEGIVSSAYRTK